MLFVSQLNSWWIRKNYFKNMFSPFQTFCIQQFHNSLSQLYLCKPFIIFFNFLELKTKELDYFYLAIERQSLHQLHGTWPIVICLYFRTVSAHVPSRSGLLNFVIFCLYLYYSYYFIKLKDSDTIPDNCYVLDFHKKKETANENSQNFRFFFLIVDQAIQ